MALFENILFHAGGDDAGEALRQTVQLARKTEGQVTVVEVIEPLSQLKKLAITAVMPAAEIREKRLTKALEKLDALVKLVREQGVSIETKVLEGRPSIELVRDVLRHDRDLLVRPSIHRLSLGSEAMQVLRVCPCPVWVVKGRTGKQPRRVLAAVDLDLTDEANAGLNDEILSIATTLAKVEDTTLHVVHAWYLVGGGAVREHVVIDEVFKEVRAKRRQDFDELLARHGCDKTNTKSHLIKGFADLVVPKVASAEEIDVVVMGSLGRTGIAGFFMGNTAETILGEVGCSVLTLKPAGFKTPVILD